MTTVEIVNPLCDGEEQPRLSFQLFVRKIKGYVEHFGRETLVLTWRSDLNNPSERIAVEELDKPRSGIFRAQLANDARFVETQYTNSMDTAPRDGRSSIDRSYQELIEMQTVRLSHQTQELVELQAAIKTERQLRFAAEEAERVAQRRIEELEAELEASEETILDASLIELGQKIFGTWMGVNEHAEAAARALDVIEQHPKVVAVLQEETPFVLMLLSEVAGEGDGNDDSENEDGSP